MKAMTSLRGVAPSDSPLVSGLEKEVESLQTERREVESWLNQAESWAAHMGQWKATVGMPPQVKFFSFFRLNSTLKASRIQKNSPLFVLSLYIPI